MPFPDYNEKNHSSAAFESIGDGERLALLNEQLKYAKLHSSFYAEHLSGVNCLSSLAEISALPLMSSEDIVLQGGRLVCVPASAVQRIVSLFTSGSSGKPKRVYFTRGDLARTVVFFAEGMSQMCARGDRVAIMMPCRAPDGIGDLLSRGLLRFGAVPLLYGMVSGVSELSERLMRDKPELIVGMPWQVRLLAQALPQLRPKTVLLSGDLVPTSMYGFLEDKWGCNVLSHFGMTETGYGCAVETFAHDGLHLRRDELHAEIIDLESGESLPAGKMGELVISTLRREAMPLIRYRTGDLASLLPNGSIARVYGRRSCGVPVPGISRALRLFEEAACPEPSLLDYGVTWNEETACLTICAQAPPGNARLCRKRLSSAALSVFGDAPPCTVRLSVLPVLPEAAHAAFPAKRIPLKEA